MNFETEGVFVGRVAVGVVVTVLVISHVQVRLCFLVDVVVGVAVVLECESLDWVKDRDRRPLPLCVVVGLTVSRELVSVKVEEVVAVKLEGVLVKDGETDPGVTVDSVKVPGVTVGGEGVKVSVKVRVGLRVLLVLCEPLCEPLNVRVRLTVGVPVYVPVVREYVDDSEWRESEEDGVGLRVGVDVNEQEWVSVGSDGVGVGDPWDLVGEA